MRIDDIDRGFAFVAIAATFVAGMVALSQGLAHEFGETMADFVTAFLWLCMSASIALEIRR